MDRFIKSQKRDYNTALKEITKGRKESHWIWYIFPQITGLGSSYMCRIYDIKSLDEAKEYLDNEYLCNHLIEITKALLTHKNKDIKEIMNIDDCKLLSCMTLFNKADENNKCGGIFQQVIDVFYGGIQDQMTLIILENQEKEKLKVFNNKNEINENEKLDDSQENTKNDNNIDNNNKDEITNEKSIDNKEKNENKENKEKNENKENKEKKDKIINTRNENDVHQKKDININNKDRNIKENNETNVIKEKKDYKKRDINIYNKDKNIKENKIKKNNDEMSIENNSNYEKMDIDEEEPTINPNKYKYKYHFSNAQKTNNNPNNTKNYNINTVGAKYNNKNEIKPVKSQDTRNTNTSYLQRKTNNQINADKTNSKSNNGVILPIINGNNHYTININNKIKSQKKEIKRKTYITKNNNRSNKSTANRIIGNNKQIQNGNKNITNNKNNQNNKSSVGYRDKKITDYYKP